jgi:hypothetical protein
MPHCSDSDAAYEALDVTWLSKPCGDDWLHSRGDHGFSGGTNTLRVRVHLQQRGATLILPLQAAGLQLGLNTPKPGEGKLQGA